MATQLTDEQRNIVHHPLHQHARVLAVAGSGKTTTMVHRIKHLVLDLNQDPRRIKVLMFNKRAREDFEWKLSEAIFEKSKRPKIQTFHSIAYEIIRLAQREGFLPSAIETWEGERREMALICMHRAIDSLLQDGLIVDDVDPNEALDAVGLWKASLIPPERAAHRADPDLPFVYRRFEEFRNQSNGMTYDDFVPTAIRIAETSSRFHRRCSNHWDHLIVDEYQDVNYGQQQLVRLLAGTRADVMVVGDDDQTIYEWRAARPHYILEGFKNDFDKKPIVDYPLSRTFRFGPLLAQAAQNVISLNARRFTKPIVAHFMDKVSEVDIVTSSEADLEMAREVSRLVRGERVPPTEIAVLGRTYAQLGGLQTVFVQHKIPFRVYGAATIFDRDENRTLVDYVRLALHWDQSAKALKALKSESDESDSEESAQIRRCWRRSREHGPVTEAIRAIQSVANTPSRMIPRTVLKNTVEDGHRHGLSLGASIEQLTDVEASPLREAQRENIEDLIDCVRLIQEELGRGAKAHIILDKVIERTDYMSHFEQYYGEGLPSLDRQESVRLFVEFTKDLALGAEDFIEYLSKLDTKQGLTDDKVLIMTTIHRTKGLDFDYVFIPSCDEGYMPVHIDDEAGVYDKDGIVPDHPSSPAIENERRLFYVGITRAKKRVYIGALDQENTKSSQSSGDRQSSRFLEELQLAPTRDLVRFAQDSLADGIRPAGLIRLLEEHMRPWAGRHQLVRSVVRNYLKDVLSEGFLDRVENLLSQTEETPFSYANKYPEVDMRGKFVMSSEEPPTQDNDDDPWASIGITI